MAPDEGATATQVGEFLGIATRSVAELAKNGIAVKLSPNRYDLRATVSRYCDDLRKQIKASGGPTAAGERAKLAAAQAEYVSLKNAKARGELLPTVDVERRWTAILGGVRATLMTIPARVGAKLPGLSQADVAVIEAEVRATLTDAAHGDA
jgi:phage terminase Nu1 subunit (DNA packaging protein)